MKPVPLCAVMMAHELLLINLQCYQKPIEKINGLAMNSKSIFHNHGSLKNLLTKFVI